MKHKLQRVIKTFFWWDNPKAGALFGTLVATIVCVLALATVLVLAIVSDEDLGRRLAMSFYLCEKTHRYLFLVCLILFVGSAVGGLALVIGHYAVHLARRRLGLPLWKSVVWGLTGLIPVFGLLAFWCPCALKLNMRKALKGFAACLVMTGVAVALRFVLPRGHIAICGADVLALASWVIAITSMPGAKQVGRWAFLPPLLLALLYTAFGILYARLDYRAKRYFQEEQTESRMSVTRDDLKKRLTGDVSVDDAPYSVLVSASTRKILTGCELLPHKGKSPFAMFRTDEECEAFDTYIQTNAAVFAEIDRVLAQEPPVKFAYAEYIWTDQDNATTSTFGFSELFALLRFYNMKSTYALRKKDVQGVLDADARMQTLQCYVEMIPAGAGTARFIGNIERIRYSALERAFPLLPDSALEQLKLYLSQRNLREDDDALRDAFQSQIMDDLFQHTIEGQSYRAQNDFYKRLKNDSDIQRMIDLCYTDFQSKTILCSVAQLRKRYRQMDMLKRHTEFFRSHNQGQFIWDDNLCPGCTPAEGCKPWEFGFPTRFHRILKEQRLWLENQDAMLIAIAVEQYRRKHQNLPETLETLVPEFMDAVPTAALTGKPFEYTAGEIGVPSSAHHTMQDYTVNGYCVSNGGDEQKRTQVRCVVPLHSQETHEHENGR